MRPLHAEALDSLENVQQSLRLHPLQDVAERDEGSGAPRTRTAATKNINSIIKYTTVIDMTGQSLI